MSILQRGIAREFGVRQARSPEKELIGANRVGCEKIVRARSANDVILIDTVATNSNRADKNAVAIQRKAAGENCNTIRQIQSDAIPKWR